MKYFYKTSLAAVSILGAALLFIVPQGVQAQQVSTTADARAECIDALNISEDLLSVGTYNIRLQNCIRQRRSVNLSKSRANRLHSRVTRLLNRSNRNSRRAVFRRLMETPRQPTQQELFSKIQYRPQQAYMKLFRVRQNPMREGSFPPNPAIRRADLQKALDACTGIGDAREKSICVEKQKRRLRAGR